MRERSQPRDEVKRKIPNPIAILVAKMIMLMTSIRSSDKIRRHHLQPNHRLKSYVYLQRYSFGCLAMKEMLLDVQIEIIPIIAQRSRSIIVQVLSFSYHRDIRRIRHLLPLSAATALANSLVSSKLDYCNSLYNGISQANLNKIQRIQNTLARVVTNTSKFEHITPILKKLHWLPIKQRIDYKLCLLTYKTLQIQQPTYLYNSPSFPSHSVYKII